MAEVTIELHRLLKSNFELFDFDYDFDDRLFADELEQSVIDHFYFHEIGFMPDEFKHRFRAKWKDMIGYYNKLHNTTLLEYNPLINYKLNEALEELRNSSNTTNTKAQGTLSGQGTDELSGNNKTSGFKDTDSTTTTAEDGKTTSEDSGTTSNTTDTTATSTTEKDTTNIGDSTTEQSGSSTADNNGESYSESGNFPNNANFSEQSLSNFRENAQRGETSENNRSTSDSISETSSTSSSDENVKVDSNDNVLSSGNTSGTSERVDTKTGENVSSVNDIYEDNSLVDETRTNSTSQESVNDTETTSEVEDVHSYAKTIEGLTGITYQELIRQERESLIRIKSMVKQELKSLFILVY